MEGGREAGGDGQKLVLKSFNYLLSLNLLKASIR